MFEPGARVTCINDRFPTGINDIMNALPRKGSVYTVRDIVPGVTFGMNETISIYLEELVNRPNQHGIEPGFHCSRFREAKPHEIKKAEASCQQPN